MRAVSAALLLPLVGCGIFGGGEPKIGELKASELERSTQSLADRHVMVVAGAVDEIKRIAETPEKRNEAHLLKLRTALSAYDIVTGAGPVQQLMDLAVLVELQWSVWSAERLAEQMFGPRGQELLSQAFEQSRSQAWELCGRALPKKAIQKLQATIQEWRRNNPDTKLVHLTRFDVIVGGPQKDFVSALLGLVGGAIDLVSPINIDPMAASVDSVHLLSGRMFLYFKRLPMIIEWQTEAIVMNALKIPEAQKIVENMTRVSDQAAGVLKQVEGLLEPGAEVDGRPINATLHETREMALALKEAVATFHGLVKDLKGPPEEKDAAPKADKEPGRPFDIRDYGDTAREVTQVLREARGVLESEKAVTRVEKMVGRTARDTARHARQVIRYAALWAALLIVLLGVVLGLYRYFSVQIAVRK